MNYLLDTHVFIWLDSDPDKLTEAVADICMDERNSLSVSMATLWEMQIKIQIGKLRLRLPLVEMIHNHQQENSIKLLAIELEHILKFAELPLIHKDPFDRLLIAQAQTENLLLISHDPTMKRYLSEVIW